MKKKRIFQISRFIIFIIFLGLNIFLIVESLTPSQSSAKQSNSIGNAIVDIVNDFNGDQAEIIEPEKVSILNKIDNVDTLSKMTLEINTLPENTRYKSYHFISSDNAIAEIDEYGNVLYKKEGTVTISVINSYNEDIKDSFTVHVNDIKATSIQAAISNLEKDSDGIYTLYIGNIYNIKTTILPHDTTNKEVNYYVEDNNFIEVSSGSINVLDESNDTIISIHVLVNDLEEIIKVKTVEEPNTYIPVTSFSVSDILGYEDSIVSISKNISFYPIDSSNKKYEIVEIDDTSIATIYNATSIKLKGSGSTTISIKSLDTNTISIGNIKVNERPQLEDYSINFSDGTIIKGESKKITISNLIPNNSKIKTSSYESLNPDILSVTSLGLVKGLSVGEGIIRVTINGIIKDISIEVLNNEESTTDFNISYLKGENPYIVVGDKIKLSDYFKVEEFIPTEPIYNTIIYNLESGNAILSSGYLTPLEEGLINIRIIHKSSGISKEVSLKAYSKISIEGNLNKDIIINQEISYKINNNSIYEAIVTVSNNNVDVSLDKDELKIVGKKEGEAFIRVYPSYESSQVSSGMILIHLSINHKYTSAMDIHFDIKSKSKEEKELDNPDHINLYKNDTISYSIAYDLDITKKKLIITSSNKDVIDIMNQKLVIKDIGDTTLEFKEAYSNIVKTITVHVKNFVSIKEDKSLIITGNYEFDGKTITIINGEVISIKYNFTNTSTIESCSYSSSNLDIVTIGEDGVLTPIKTGEATIVMVVSDESQTFVETEIKVIVKQKDFVENIADFIYVYVRKGLGHFGIFFILAIFAALSIFMFFKNDKWYIILIKVIIVFAYGFLFAGFTEYLQTLTPGRCGLLSDVLVDFSGYSLGASLLSIGFIIYLIVLWYKKKRSKNLEE